MKGLLVKDFCLIRQQKKFLAILLLLAIVLNYNSDGSFVIGYLTFVCSFLIISSISYDEYDNGYSFLFTLPVGRKTYVQSKYIFAVLLSSCSWMTGCVIASVFYLARNQVGRLWDPVVGDPGLFGNRSSSAIQVWGRKRKVCNVSNLWNLFWDWISG